MKNIDKVEVFFGKEHVGTIAQTGRTTAFQCIDLLSSVQLPSYASMIGQSLFMFKVKAL